MKVIAEIGTAHGGNIEKARALIDEAASCGADIIKFQWVYADEILHPETGFVNLPGGSVRLYDRFKDLEVSTEFFKECLEYTHQKGLLFACSPFGLRSLEELASIKPDAIKIASPEVNHIPLLKACSSYYGKIPIILSSGVSTLGDIEKAIAILTGGKAPNKEEKSLVLPPLTLLHCITFYPAPEDEYNVRCVDTLHKIFGIPTGISDHSLDPVLVPVLASAMGGSMLEKHITLSKKTDGLDDPVALEEDQFSQMVNAVRQTEAIFGRFGKDFAAGGNSITNARLLADGTILSTSQAEIIRQMEMQYGEEKVLKVLGSGAKRLAASEINNYGRTNRSLHYTSSLEKGHKIESKDIAVLRTEKVLTPGIPPEFLDTVIGSVLQQDVTSGNGVNWQDLLQKN
ncbi:MAG: N-acetylneuraminate synthase family protein [Treponema sp.]|nr:N-acetylneuraminate synthase family protein [Treponema sp.]